jgi:uncharacterized protein YmfQ (DUF2313 family)
MSISAADFEYAMSALLPQGPVWDRFRETSNDLLSALAQEPARLVEDADATLEGHIPDSSSADLDHFEKIVGVPDSDLTDAERLVRIQTLLFGRRKVTRAYLEQILQTLAGDANVTLLQRAYAPAAAGVMNVGDSLASGEWDYTWLAEYMPDATALGTPDVFSDWSGFVAVADNNQPSPVTLDTTAARATIPATPTVAYRDLDTTVVANGSVVYASIWVRPVSVSCQLNLSLLGRGGGTTTTSHTCEVGAWTKLSVEGATGTGATTPRIRLSVTGGAQQFDLSWLSVGVRSSVFEAATAEFFPIHTQGHFSVQGEFATSLAHADQLEVML